MSETRGVDHGNLSLNHSNHMQMRTNKHFLPSSSHLLHSISISSSCVYMYDEDIRATKQGLFVWIAAESEYLYVNV